MKNQWMVQQHLRSCQCIGIFPLTPTPLKKRKGIIQRSQGILRSRLSFDKFPLWNLCPLRLGCSTPMNASCNRSLLYYAIVVLNSLGSIALICGMLAISPDNNDMLKDFHWVKGHYNGGTLYGGLTSCYDTHDTYSYSSCNFSICPKCNSASPAVVGLISAGVVFTVLSIYTGYRRLNYDTLSKKLVSVLTNLIACGTTIGSLALFLPCYNAFLRDLDDVHYGLGVLLTSVGAVCVVCSFLCACCASPPAVVRVPVKHLPPGQYLL